MIYGILILICIILLLGIAAWFIMRQIKNKKKIEKSEMKIPIEILEDFENAEKQMKGGLKKDGTTTNAYQIIWEIAKSKGDYTRTESVRDNSRAEQPIDNGELHPEPNRGQSIQAGASTEFSEDRKLTRQFNKNNIRKLLSRIRRK